MAKERAERKERMKQKRKADMLKGNPFKLRTSARAEAHKRPVRHKSLDTLEEAKRLFPFRSLPSLANG